MLKIFLSKNLKTNLSENFPQVHKSKQKHQRLFLSKMKFQHIFFEGMVKVTKTSPISYDRSKDSDRMGSNKSYILVIWFLIIYFQTFCTLKNFHQ